MKNEPIILIGGAPTTGKSEMAKLLSGHLHIPWISTDQLRSVMKAVADRNQYPTLFDTEGMSAEEFLSKYSAEEIAQGEFDQGKDVWPGVVGLINSDNDWDKGFIIEGVNILPHLVFQDFKDNDSVRAVFLVDEDADRMRDVIFTRGLYADAREYSDDVKEKEVEWATLFSHKLKKEVEKYGYPYIEVTKNKDDLNAVLKALDL